MRLTFYLFKKEVNNYRDCLITDKLNGDNRYEDVSPQELTTDFEYKIYLQRNIAKPPRWIDFIDQFANIENKENLKNQVNSFVILIKHQDRFFAVTGGFGFHALDKEKTESNFGLIVALNSINDEGVKFLDVKNIDVNTKQKRIITSMSSPIREFDVDFNKELLRIISGSPIDKTLANSIKGSDSLTLSGEIDFQILGQKCAKLLELFTSKNYKESYGFIDNILPIKDSNLEEELNALLTEKIQARTTDDKINITYPDQFEYDKCDRIKIFGMRRQPVEVENLTLESVYEFLEQMQNIETDTLKEQIFVIGLDHDDNPVTPKVPLFNFLAFETVLRNFLFVLSNKQWFQVNPDYVTQIESELKKIDYLENYLPEYNHVSEAEYNKDASKKDASFILFDLPEKQCKPSMGGKVEVCDLLKMNGEAEFIHNKKDYASSSLSHLFAQGSVSLDLILFDSNFKKDFESKAGQLFDKSSSQITVSYGIITKKQGNLLENLPVFSKIHLLTHVNLIRRLQAKPRVIKIERTN